jgi:hypothetical protein
MATRNPIVLDKPEDWPMWIDEIRGSTPNSIWPLIDPDLTEHEEFIQKPRQPRPQDVNATRANFLELTAHERTAYDYLFKYWQASLKEYEKQEKGLQDAKDLIRTRVSNAKSALLTGSETAREWLAVLKEATSASNGFITYQASHKYLAVFRRNPTLATINKWLTDWELAMVEANKHEIPEVASGRWLRDLAIAIKPISETLNATFIKHSTNDAKNDPSLYLKAGVRIREFVGTNNNPSKGRVTRGAAFAAEFDGEQATDEDNRQEEDNERKARKRAGTTSTPRNSRSGKRKMISCKACGLQHDLSQCYYVFPELRHEGFQPIDEIAARVSRALKRKQWLVDDVETIRNEMREQEGQQ